MRGSQLSGVDVLIEPVYGLLLVVAGVAAGFINTLAGGGSMLTLPALMLLGMPADVANATNRVGIVLQSMTSAWGFHKHGKLDTSMAVVLLIPTVLGGLVGALIAAFTPAEVLKPVLLSCMVAMALLMVFLPDVVAPPLGTQAKTLKQAPQAWFWLFLAGVYGGFIQAGVGFMLIAALAGSLRFDLVRTNALKVVCTAAFASVALLIFIWQDLVLWVPGLLLALGTVVGAQLSVKFAITASPKVLKWFLFVMVFIACIGAFIKT